MYVCKICQVRLLSFWYHPHPCPHLSFSVFDYWTLMYVCVLVLSHYLIDLCLDYYQQLKKSLHTYILSYIHTYINPYIYTCIGTYIHTCTHTYIHSLPSDTLLCCGCLSSIYTSFSNSEQYLSPKLMFFASPGGLNHTQHTQHTYIRTHISYIHTYIHTYN